MDDVYVYTHSTYGSICSVCASTLHAKEERTLPHKTAETINLECYICKNKMRRLPALFRKHVRRPCPACKPHVEKAIGKSELTESAHYEAWAFIYLVQVGRKHADNTYSMVCPRCNKPWHCHNVEERIEEELDALLDD